MKINRLEQFVKQLSNKKLWIFASSILVACITYAGNFFFQIPDQLAAMDNTAVDFQEITADYDNVLQAMGLLNESFGLYVECITTYSSLREAALQGNLSTDLFNEATIKADQAHNNIRVNTGTLKGMSFHRSEYKEFSDEIIEDLNQLDEAVVAIQNLYHATASGNVIDIKQLGEVLSAEFEKTDELSYELIERVTSFEERFMAMDNKNKIRIQQETQKLGLYRIQQYAFIGAILYVVGFVSVSLRSWIKFNQKVNRRSRKRLQKK